MSGRGSNYKGWRWGAMAASSLILLTILFAYLKLDSSKRFNQTFWVAMAGLAPTLAIAYVVAIGQALSTYSQAGRSDPTPHRETKVTMAFAGGAIGIAFTWLQAIVVLFAFRSILYNRSVVGPNHLLQLEAVSTFVVPIVTFLAYGWSPWRRSEEPVTRPDGPNPPSHPR
jgi:hypothetical protein